MLMGKLMIGSSYLVTALYRWLANPVSGLFHLYTLWLFNIAMEHGPFLDDKHDELSIKNGDFP